MRMTYQGTDITPYAAIEACVYRDASVDRMDTLDMVLGHAEAWARWQPQVDDAVRIVTDDGLDTGTLYLCAVQPQGRRYRLIASGLPAAARRRAWGTWQNITLAQVAESCALEGGVRAALYGVEGAIRYPFLLRRNEGPAAFLSRLGRCEGFAVKATGGRLCAIGFDWARGRDAVQRIALDVGQDGVTLTRLAAERVRTLAVLSPWAQAAATDTGAPEGAARTLAMPVRDAAQAARWARGLLLDINRGAEALTITSTLNPALYAMARVDIEDAAAGGAWLVDDVEHDLIRRTTRARCLRAIDTIR